MLSTAVFASAGEAHLIPPAASEPAKLHLGEQTLRSSYEKSILRCQHGHAGVLVSLHEGSTPSEYVASLKANMLPEHAAESRFLHTTWSFPMISMSRVHPATLTQILQHQSTSDVAANVCGAHA